MKHIFFSVIVLALFATSCGDNALVKPTKDKSWEWTKDDKSVDNVPCYAMIYPVTLLLPDGDGTEITVDSKEEWYDVMADWKKEHPDASTYPELQYPIDVKIYNGDIRTVENDAEFALLKKKCKDDDSDKEKQSCFWLIYPVTLELEDGSTEDVADAKEWHAVAVTWKKDHPDSANPPQLQYPVNIKLPSGDIREVSSKEEMAVLKEKCKDNIDRDTKRDYKPKDTGK